MIAIYVLVQPAKVLPIPFLPTPVDGEIGQVERAVARVERHFIFERDVPVEQHVRNDDF